MKLSHLVGVEEVFVYVCQQILAINLPHPTRVGINGVDGSGKTFFAQKLTEELRKRSKREIISASIDNFHNPRKVRYLRGCESAEGFYKDSFNQQALVTNLLEPLGPTGSRQYRTAMFDLKTDTPIEQEWRSAASDAIFIVEGIFLFEKTLLPYFELKIFLDAPFDLTLHRMLKRDMTPTKSEEAEMALYKKRYMAGQQLYFKLANPREAADIIIDNTDYFTPKIIKTSENI